MSKRLLTLILFATAFLGLGGCVYDPAYYHHAGGVYDDGTSTYAEPYYDSYYAAGPYYDPWYYGYGYGYPAFGLGFSYYGGGHRHGGHHYHHYSGTHTSHNYHHH